jgi:hypothetical protein
MTSISAYSNPLRLSPRKTLQPGDPVRVKGKRGLYQFRGADTEGTVAQVSDPVGRARFLPVDTLKSAGRTPPEAVLPDDRIAVISKAAKTGARRRRRA